ncbi:MAG: diacylglycerol kinase family lipid kinase [Bacteroidales bacterium]|nr:diacylglycerol kinase family lipid kinase [Bacteroidales bacterium]
MTETKTEWYFIVNPRAGSGKTMSEWVPAEHKMEKLGIRYVTAYTDYKRHAMGLAYDAAVEGYRHIVAVGGDGSIHEVMNGVAKFCDWTGTPTEDFYLGVMPIGSGNDWIKSLGVPHDVSDVVDLIKKESFTRMDVVQVNCADNKMSYMTNIGGIGFDPHVCKRVNMQKEAGMRGKRIYLNALYHTMRTLNTLNVKVIADGKTAYEGLIYSMALGNGKYSGSGMRQVPGAMFDDNLLDYTIIPKMPLGRMLKLLPHLFDGKITDSSSLICGRCTSLQVVPLDADSADIIELDGEIEGNLPISIEMANRQINVIKG